ncbi:serine/threonine protein kinase [Umezawaea endophytica]|uniref:non-specific serine/threonine protein kinase n=1 Tax=Umezawaea endophytica TaxID=1654476 RepID=A0A9X2VUE4_9PSEU|nr:serine/threonine-protein kinase [Umezawaea endophytica]MCS7482259.1 serine/threonine protein kinase [Umezawaea endophytica]
MNAVGERYLLLEQIGAGAMGVVWRAHDELLHREVAVKQLKLPDLDPVATDMARTRAMREARIAARLQHPNAIGVFDVVVQDDLPWLVMEYLPSRSLAALLAENGPLHPVEAARIGGKIAAALAAAHAAGITHRDVKPGNVLIGHDGTVKLTDFGISRAVGDGTLTEAGMISGTPAYLAPEIARGDAPDARSDVFSLGATLYAMTEDRSPYGATDNNLGLIYRAATGKIDPPSRAGTLTGPLKRLLSNDPARRPTAAQAVDLLASDEGPTSVFRRPAVEPRRAPRWIVPVVAALVLIAGGVVGGLVWLLPLVDEHLVFTFDESVTVQESGTGQDPNVPVDALSPVDAAANFVRDHYRQAASDPTTAWNNLTESFRPTLEEYEGFWSKYDEVQPDILTVSARPNGSYTVDVQLTFVLGSSLDVQTYRVGVEVVDGARKIVSSSKI